MKKALADPERPEMEEHNIVASEAALIAENDLKQLGGEMENMTQFNETMQPFRELVGGAGQVQE